MKIWSGLGTLSFRLPRIPPPPMKIGQDFGLWVLGYQEYPPHQWKLVRTLDFEFRLLRISLPKMKICQDLGLWVLGYQEYPPTNENWSGLWTLSFRLLRIPPHQSPMKICQDLGLWVLGYQEYPPPNGGNECVETNRCIPHGYRLVVVVHGVVVAITSLPISVWSGWHYYLTIVFFSGRRSQWRMYRLN